MRRCHRLLAGGRTRLRLRPTRSNQALLRDGDAVCVRRSHVSNKSGAELSRSPVYRQRHVEHHGSFVLARGRKYKSARRRLRFATRYARCIDRRVGRREPANLSLLRSHLVDGAARQKRASPGATIRRRPEPECGTVRMRFCMFGRAESSRETWLRRRRKFLPTLPAASWQMLYG